MFVFIDNNEFEKAVAIDICCCRVVVITAWHGKFNRFQCFTRFGIDETNDAQMICGCDIGRERCLIAAFVKRPDRNDTFQAGLVSERANEWRDFNFIGFGKLIRRWLPSALNLGLKDAGFRLVTACFIVFCRVVVGDAASFEAAGVTLAAIGVFFFAVFRRRAFVAKGRAFAL